MIMKIEYKNINVFSKSQIFIIELLNGEFYYSNNVINKIKINKELTEQFLKKIFEKIIFLKKINNNTFVTDESECHLNVILLDNTNSFYDGENYDLSNISELLQEFDIKVMRRELEN